MRGVKSNGMLLAASDAAHENVELLVVPEGSEPGERIWFGEETDGESQDAALTPNQVSFVPFDCSPKQRCMFQKNLLFSFKRKRCGKAFSPD